MKINEILNEGALDRLKRIAATHGGEVPEQMEKDILRLQKAGWTDDEIVDEMRNVEDVNPDISEKAALAAIKRVRERVAARLGKKPEAVNESLPKWTKHPTRKGVLTRTITPEDKAKMKAAEQAKELRAEAAKRRKEEERRKQVQRGERKLRLTDDDLYKIWSKIEAAVGQCVPDGDPWDIVGPWFRRTFGNVPELRPYLDKAVRKYAGSFKSYDDYLAEMWDAYEESAGHYGKKDSELTSEERFPFRGKNNPWRSR